MSDLTVSANIDSLLACANYAAARSALGLAIGTNVQAFDADLTALAAIASTGFWYYRSAANTWGPVTVGSGLDFTGGTLTATGGSGNVATDAIWAAKGDLAAGTGADTAVPLTVGANGTVLTADDAQTTGMIWAAPAAAVVDEDADYDWTGAHDFSGGTVVLPTISTLTATTLNATGMSLSGAMTVTETGYLLLDATLSADGKFSGTAIDGTAGATLAFGDVIYLDPTDSRWELCDANAAAGADGDCRGLVGVCVLAAAADASATRILLHGTVRADAAFPTFTVGAPVYVSETAGDATSTAPTTTDAVSRVIGWAIDGNTLFVNLTGLWTTHA